MTDDTIKGISGWNACRTIGKYCVGTIDKMYIYYYNNELMIDEDTDTQVLDENNCDSILGASVWSGPYGYDGQVQDVTAVKTNRVYAAVLCCK